MHKRGSMETGIDNYIDINNRIAYHLKRTGRMIFTVVSLSLLLCHATCASAYSVAASSSSCITVSGLKTRKRGDERVQSDTPNSALTSLLAGTQAERGSFGLNLLTFTCDGVERLARRTLCRMS